MSVAAPPTDLEARVAALEDQLAELRQPDSLFPNVITFDGQKIGATFSGHVKAAGVDLAEAPSLSYTGIDAVDWLDATGTLREFIQGSLFGGRHTLVLAASPGGAQSFVFIDSDGVAAGKIAVQAAGQGELVVQDQGGASNFAQLGAKAVVIQNSGVINLSWPGGTPNSNPTFVAPAGAPGNSGNYFACAIFGGTTDFYPMIVAPVATAFEVIGVSSGGSPPAGHTEQCYWFSQQS